MDTVSFGATSSRQVVAGDAALALLGRLLDVLLKGGGSRAMIPIVITLDRAAGRYVCRDPRKGTQYVTDDRDDAFSEARKWAGRRRTVRDFTHT